MKKHTLIAAGAAATAGAAASVVGAAYGIYRFWFYHVSRPEQLTTEELIQTALTEHLPHIKRAVLVQDISPELLDEARSILKMRHGG